MKNKKAQGATSRDLHEKNRSILDGMKRIAGDDRQAGSTLPIGDGVIYVPTETPRHRLDWLSKTIIVRHDGDGIPVGGTISKAEQAAVPPSAGRKTVSVLQQNIPVIRYTPPGVIHKMPLAK